VLIRAVGPGLAPFDVPDRLADPVLRVTDIAGVTLDANDNWETGPNQSELRVAMTARGAFPLPTGSTDAALLVTLAPGNYTAIVTGAGDMSGTALVEVYDMP